MKTERVLLRNYYFFQEGPGVRKWQFTDEGTKLLNVGNINNGKIDLSTTKIFISDDLANNQYKHFLIDEGDLLIACSGIVVDNFHNKIAFIEKMHLPLCLNTSTMRFKSLTEDSTLPYLKYFFQTTDFKGQLRRLITGSAQLNFGPSHISQVTMPLPPVHLQKAIADKLDKADALRKKDKELLAQYDELAQAIFIDMFGDPVKNEKGWEKDILGNHCLKVQIGPFGSQLHLSDYVDEGIPLINPTNIKNGYINYDASVKITKEKFDTLPNYHLNVNDVIMSRRGDLSKIGIVDKENTFCGTGSLFLRLKNNLEPVFCYYLLSEKSTIDNLYIKAQGVTMANLNKQIILNLEIVIPPIQLQTQFAEKIKNLEAQKAIVKQQAQQSEDLFQALLQESFNFN